MNEEIEKSTVEKTDVTESARVSKNSRKHFKYRSEKCLNCEHPLDLSDRYCPYCSQLNSTKSLTLKDFITEFFSSLISYDSRLRFTISDLLFKPGVISKNYIFGKRLRYTNPFRFFLSVSIIYFLLYSLINFFNPGYDAPFVNFSNDTEESDSLISFDEDYDDEEEKEPFIVYTTNSKDSINKQSKKAREINKDTVSSGLLIFNGDTIYNKQKSYSQRVAQLDTIEGFSNVLSKFQLFRDYYNDKEIKHPDTALDSLQIEKTRFNRWLYSRNKSLDHIGDSPKDFINYLFSKVPFFVFFFAPIYTLFLWLLYARSKFTYMEHLGFIFHIFSFSFLALIIATIPDLIFDVTYFTQIIIILIGPIYFYLALRKFYGQSHIKTALKYLFLNIVFFISSIIAAIVFFAGTAALY